MRTIIGYIALAVAVMLTGAAPANASWTCDGPAYVCGSPAAAKASKAKVTSNKSNKSSETASYDKPAKKAKKSTETASYDKPAKKAKKSYSASNSDGGSYSGKASYYWEPQRVASGGWFNPNAMTAAHKTLPFGTKVRVTNRNNGQSVVVTINDRGPYVAGRVIDLSRAAAQSINMTGSGVVPVSVAVLGKG